MTAPITLDETARQMTPAGLVTLVFDRVLLDERQELIDLLQRRLNEATFAARMADARRGSVCNPH